MTTTRTAQGKPVVRRGRKARGLACEIAQLPGLMFCTNPSTGDTEVPYMPYFSWNRRRLAAALAVSACAALTASGSAFADTTIADDGAVTALTTAASNAECAAPTLLQPFAFWKDNRSYVLAPNGNFDDPTGGGWRLTSGARILDEVGDDGTVDSVLDMPTGAVAISPTLCVDLTYPTARTWVRNVVGDGDLAVSVMYDAGKTAQVPLTVGHVHGNKEAAWVLSPDVKIQPQLAGKREGWRRVAFVLKAGGKSSDFRVDDFYVDPRMVR
jgi:hypothetical protein